MHAVATIVMIIGVIGFVLNYMGMVSVGSLAIWGGIAVVGMVVTIMTRQVGD